MKGFYLDVKGKAWVPRQAVPERANIKRGIKLKVGCRFQEVGNGQNTAHPLRKLQVARGRPAQERGLWAAISKALGVQLLVF